LNKITDLKSAPKRQVQKIQHCKGRVKKKNHGGKIKLAHITGGINLFTHYLTTRGFNIVTNKTKKTHASCKP
jgi:hypothetical protein